MQKFSLCKEDLQRGLEVYEFCEKLGIEKSPLDVLSVRAMKELLKYKGAEEQGRMIIFPCNKGDKIYEFYRECVEDRLEAGETPEDIINMREVRYFEYDGDTAYIYASQSLPSHYFSNDGPFCVPVSEIGDTVFLSYEEAEAELKKIGGESTHDK